MSADRQTCAVFQQRNNLQANHGLVWVDFKQDITVPLASVQTSSMFYGPARQELTCIAFAIFENKEGVTSQKNVMFLSEIIDHTSLVTGEYFREAMQFLSPPGSFERLLLWHDCGGHFRSYEHIAFLIREVFQKHKCPTQVNFFCEKHGKGLIDGIFGRVQGWIESYLRQGEKLIASLADLLKVCSEGAERDTTADPGGPTWVLCGLVTVL